MGGRRTEVNLVLAIAKQHTKSDLMMQFVLKCVYLFKMSSSNMIETSYGNIKNCFCLCCNSTELTPMTLIMSSLYQEKRSLSGLVNFQIP